MRYSLAMAKSYTVIGRYEDTGEVTLHYIHATGEDVHYEVLRHWGQVTNQGQYEVLAVLPGELQPAATPATLKMYVERHFQKRSA